MTPSEKMIAKLGIKTPETNATQPTHDDNGRRSFFKKSALGGIALGGSMLLSPIEDMSPRQRAVYGALRRHRT